MSIKNINLDEYIQRLQGVCYTLTENVSDLKESAENLLDVIKVVSDTPNENNYCVLMDKLTDFLVKCNYQYYQLDNPSIDDSDFDLLLRLLEILEGLYPNNINSDSPSKRVGGNNDTTFQKVTHQVQMGSLQDVFDIDELRAFDSRVREVVEPEYVVEAKIDGLSVSLEYQNGRLKIGSTRGDGFVGEDVTANIKTIKSIPLSLREDLSLLEVRGEVYMPRDAFEEIVRVQLENDEAPFKNPRNAAAGSLRQKNSSVTAKRNLDVFIFNIQRIEGKDITTHSQGLDYLKSLGFTVSPSYKTFDDIEEVIKEILRIGEARYSFPFDIDGAVVKVNSLSDRELLGSTSKYPKWAVAFKYPPEEKETILLDIEINVGRTGALTPTAVFEPVLLAGSTVSRAVLHNQDFINEKDIRIGDTITIRKAGDIIPEVLSATNHQEGSVTFKIPSICPSCKQPVQKEEGQAVLRCINPRCPSAIFRSIIHFASRNAMNIDGLGPAVIQLLIDEELIKSAADLYELKYDDLIHLERFAEKSVNNLLNAIEKSKQNPLSRLIFGMGIRNVGQKAAELICQKYNTVQMLEAADFDGLLEIDGIGDIIAKSVVLFFENVDNKKIISRLSNYGLNMQEPILNKGTILEGLTFVITGTLSNMSREEASKLITDNGGKVSSSVSKKTSFLLAGDEAGSKLKKANELGVKVISKDELLEMLNS